MERVVVVGGGVLGVLHALQARRRGLDVIHLERERGARGAGVRNFGLVWSVAGRQTPSWRWHSGPARSGGSWRASCPARASVRTDP